ncbi:transglutaminase domain-containing protein [Paenibacillus sp. P22]|uniref:transglutaminase domain-containing protein n=1 Tax=Paenibacillus TaxID=44249 RepID=UPI00040E19FF|nr:transglutaminase domain-containing protein [Paenibacillus sp. P22]
MRRHVIVNSLLAASLALSVFMLEGRLEPPVQAGSETIQPTAAAAAVSYSPRAKLVDELAAGFKGRSADFQTSYRGDHADLVKAMPDLVKQALFRDDYSAYVLESYSYKIRTVGDNSSIRVKVRYRETPEQTAAVKEKSRQTLKEIIQPGMNEEEKLRAIHDWIVRHVRYDESLTRYTAYDAVVNGTAVCQGYALLMYRMAADAGIEVRIVEGTVDSGDHAWNLVRLDGSWYHIDATWDDPVPDRGSQVRHTYFLLSDEQIRKDHSWTRDYPAARQAYKGTASPS